MLIYSNLSVNHIKRNDLFESFQNINRLSIMLNTDSQDPPIKASAIWFTLLNIYVTLVNNYNFFNV